MANKNQNDWQQSQAATQQQQDSASAKINAGLNIKTVSSDSYEAAAARGDTNVSKSRWDAGETYAGAEAYKRGMIGDSSVDEFRAGGRNVREIRDSWNNKYMLTDRVIARIQSRYKATWDDHYWNDEEDQARKAAGLMPRSFSFGYNSHNGDPALKELNLPDTDHINDYITEALEWEKNTEAKYDFYEAASNIGLQLQMSGIENSATKSYDYKGEKKTGAQIWEQTFFDALNSSDWADVRSLVQKPDTIPSELNSDKYASTSDFEEAKIYADISKAEKAAKEDPTAPSIDYDDFMAFYPKFAGSLYDRVLVDSAFDAAIYGGSDGQVTVREVISKNNELAAKQEFSNATTGAKGDKGIVDYLAQNPETTFDDVITTMKEAGSNGRQAKYARDYFIDKENSAYARDADLVDEGERQSLLEQHKNTIADINAKYKQFKDDGFARYRDSKAGSINIDTTAVKDSVVGFAKQFASDVGGYVDTIIKNNEATKREDSFIKGIEHTATAGYSMLSDGEVESVISDSLLYDGGVLNANSAISAIDELYSRGVSVDQLDRVAKAALAAPMESMEDVDRMRVNSAISEAASKLRDDNAKRRVGMVTKEKVASLGLTDFGYYNMLNRNGYASSIDQADFARSYFSEVEFAGIVQADEDMRVNLGWDNLTPEQRIALGNQYWDSKITGEKRTDYVDSFVNNQKYNTYVHKTKREQVEEQFGSFFENLKNGAIGMAIGNPSYAFYKNPIVQRTGVNIASSIVGFADMATAGIGKRDDRWQLTQDLSAEAAKANARGKSSEQDIASIGIGASSDIATDLLRTYALNGVGGAIGGGLKSVAGKAVGGIFGQSARAAAGANKIVKLASSFASEAPAIVIPAMGAGYNEAMENGATVQQATQYGLVTGAIEGVIEKMNIDSWVSGGFGSKRYAENLMTGLAQYRTAGYKAKVIGAQLLSSFLGESAEEGISYGAGLLATRGYGIDPDAEFSSAELSQQMLMGGLIGLFGAGMSLSESTSPAGVAYKYMQDNGWDKDTFDMFFAEAYASMNLSKEEREQLSKNATVFDRKKYDQTQMGISQAARNIANNNKNYPKRIASWNAEIDYRNQMLDSITTQMQAAIAQNDTKAQVVLTAKQNEMLSALSEARTTLADVKKSYADSNAQNQRAIDKGRAELNGHYVAMANLFQGEIAAMRSMNIAEMQKAKADGAIDAASDKIDAFYALGIIMDNAKFDALNAVTTELYDAEELSSTVAHDIEKAKAVLAQVKDKMQNARAGSIDQYLEEQQAAAAEMKAQLAQRDADLGAMLADKTKADHYNEISVEEEKRVLAEANKLGVTAVVEAFDDDNDRGFYTDSTGVLHINRNQPVNANGEFLHDAPGTYVFKHEFTHWLQQSAGYSDYANFVLEQMKQHNPDFDFEAYRAGKEEKYRASGMKFGKDTALHELVASYTQRYMFNGKDSIKALVQENAGVAGRLLNKIQFTIAENKLRKSGTPESRAMLQTEKLYVKAFRDVKAQEKVDAGKKISLIEGTSPSWKPSNAGVDKEYSRNASPSYDVDKVTRETYDNHAWAIEHGDITPKEYGRFFSAIGDTFHGNQESQNPDGVYVVKSYDGNNDPSLLIGTDGDAHNPSTEFIVRIPSGLSSKDVESIERTFLENGYGQASTIIESSFGQYAVKSSSRRDAQSYEEFYADRFDRKRSGGRSSGNDGRSDAQYTSQQRIGIGGASGIAGNQPGIPDTEVTSSEAPDVGASPLPPAKPATWDDLRTQSQPDDTERSSYDPDDEAFWNAWENAKDTYGTVGQGMSPRARDIDVPRRTSGDNRTSDFIRSVFESQHIREEWIPDAQKAVTEDGMGLYIPQKNSAVEKAQIDYIGKVGETAARAAFEKDVREGKVSDANNVLGMQLLADAQQRGDKESVLNLIGSLAVAATDSGRSVQVFSMLKKMGGVGSAVYAQKLIDRLNTQYAEQINSGKMQPITLSQSTIDQMMNAVSAKDVELAESAMSTEIGQQIPLTLSERIRNWRYFSMLANPTTHARNMFGNMLMYVASGAKDAVAAGYERMFVKDKSQWTHAVYNPFSEANKPIMEFANSEYALHRNDLKAGGKYGFDALVSQNKRMFDNKVLNSLGEFNARMLDDFEDGIFLKANFTRAYTQYMLAQGLSPDTITEKQKYDAAEWASSEAWRATFRDASDLADGINALAKKSKAAGVVIDAVMPFKKTPINIAKRGIDYSPAGLIEASAMLVSDLYKSKNGIDTKYTTAQIVDRFASGTVGTALAAVGYFLAKAGIMRGKGEDDKEAEKYLQATGEQPYSINVGGMSFDMSGVAPMTIPLFMGVALHDAFDDQAKKGGSEGNFALSVSDMIGVLSSATDPLMEMSFMSSLNSALQTYGTDGALGQVAVNAGKSYLGQFLPTVGGKIARAIDSTDRTAKSDATSWLGNTFDYIARSFAMKVPGLENTLEPYVNAKGEVSSQDSFGEWALDFANQFILLARAKVSNKTGIDSEIIRIYESTGKVDIFPTSPSRKFFRVKGENYPMDAETFTAYSEDRGTSSYAAIKEVMRSSAYSSMSDAEKAAAIARAVEAAEKQVDTLYKEKVGAFD